MKLNRDNIFKKYNWLREKKRPFIISCDYDGIICASFLNHYLNWDLVGFYDYNSIWLSEEAKKNHKFLTEEIGVTKNHHDAMLHGSVTGFNNPAVDKILKGEI